MTGSVHSDAIELLLKSIDQQGDTCLSSFMFGKPGAPLWQHSGRAELHVDRKAYTRALLFIRQHGAHYLREISIGDLWSRVTEFLTANYWYIGKDFILSEVTCGFDKHVSTANKAALTYGLAVSPMFHPSAVLTLLPLVAVRVADTFECDRFFLIEAAKLSDAHLPPAAAGHHLAASNFPPFNEWKGKFRKPASWLGVRSPLPQVSKKTATVILGAIALTPLPRHRFMWSGREMFGGWCSVDGGYTVSPGGQPHTPAMMEDIVITEADRPWLAVLDNLIKAEDSASSSMRRGLEYFYRAWPLDPRERFSGLCMAMDAVVAAPANHTKMAVKFVVDTIGCSVDEDRLRLLMRIRGAVIHGAAPDVYESTNYAQYYIDYGADPIFDLELIVARCLRNRIFGGKLAYHADPNQALLQQLQAAGKAPKKLASNTIIVTDA